MALTNCKECGAEVSTKAEACPKCGAKRPKSTSIGTWIIGGIFLVILIKCTFTKQDIENKVAADIAAMTPEQKEAALEKVHKADAKWACREYLQKALKVPSTADIPNYNDFEAHGIGTGPYAVTGSVEAQNSFGAKIRGSFECVVDKSGGNWQLIDLKMK